MCLTKSTKLLSLDLCNKKLKGKKMWIYIEKTFVKAINKKDELIYAKHLET